MTRRRSYICPHGLDLRVYPRCYVCDPVIKLPFDTTPSRPLGCTCPPAYIGDFPPYCPIHNPPRPYYPTITTTGTGTPFCGICNGFHIPGAGPCTASYS